MIERVVDSRVRFSMVRRVVGIGGDVRACPSTYVTLQMYMCILLRGRLVLGALGECKYGGWYQFMRWYMYMRTHIGMHMV